MGVLTLQWDNSLVDASPITNAQRIYKRVKTVGGPFLTTGFSPSNDLAKTVNEVDATVIDNKVYEFRLENLCSIGGPTANNNGTIESINFVCIVPSFAKTQTKVDVTLDVSFTDITKAKINLYKQSDNSLIATITQARAADSIVANFTALTANTTYYVTYELYAIVQGVEKSMLQINSSMAVCGADGTFNVTTSVAQDLRWIALTKVCEKADQFGIVKTITGLASPLRTWYDTVTGRMYVADIDAPGGNVYWFNPNTATSAADMVYTTAVQQSELYQNYIDAQNRRIYFVGRNSNGMIVYNIDTDSVTTVAFGVNGAFLRTDLWVLGDRIYCNNGNSQVIIIDRASLTILATIATGSIPNPTHFSSGPRVLDRVGNEIWVVSSNASIGTVGVYNLDLTTSIAEVTLPGVATWDFARYWQSIFYDSTSDRVYVADIGSSRQYTIDPATKTVIGNRQLLNREGKNNVQMSWFVNPVTNELLAAYYAINNSSDNAPKTRMYVEERADFTRFANMYEGFFIQTGPAQVTGSNMFVGANPGQPSYTGNPSWATDGSMTFLSSSLSGGNTGRGLILDLQQVDHANDDEPTGATKPNITSDPDYEPPVDPDPDCPVTYTTACPADAVTSFATGTLRWEFAILLTTRNNPAILKVRVQAYNNTTASVEGVATDFNTPFGSNYFAGSFTGLAGTNYTARVQYLGAADAVITTCLL